MTLVNPGNVLSDVSHSLAPRSKTHLPASFGTPTATQQRAIALPVCVLRSWLLVFDLKSLKVSAISTEPTGYWKDLPVKQYLVRTVRNHLWPPGDRDRIFGVDFVKQVRDMGIQEVLSAPRSPWQRLDRQFLQLAEEFLAFSFGLRLLGYAILGEIYGYIWRVHVRDRSGTIRDGGLIRLHGF